MDSDSISNHNNNRNHKSSSSSPISVVVSRCNNARDLAHNKKKKTNRSAKLKQCKLDARREQWLSQAKNKKLNGDGNGEREPSKPALQEKNISIGSPEMTNHHASDWDFPSNSLTSGCSILEGSDTVTNYSGSSSSSTNQSSSSHGSCSGNITEEEQEDGCFDDWEAVVDALAAYEKEQSSRLDRPPEDVPVNLLNCSHESAIQASSGGGQWNKESARLRKAHARDQAWRPDDAFRPQTLPNLTKQNNFPMKSNRHGRGGNNVWTGKASQTVPSSCPICYEDLDITDTSFLPCQCGFRLCLFCHKRILEDDGRCPGCRQAYSQKPVEGEAVVNEGIVTFHMAHSCSMMTRS